MNAPSNAGTLVTIQRVISEELDIPLEKLAPEARLDELGIDSLGTVEVMFRLEEIFNVRMNDDRLPIHTVQDVVDIVERLMREQGNPKS